MKRDIANVQEIMGQKDFKLRNDRHREKQKHDKRDHSKDTFVQTADS
jgi:hypothetical protein